DNALLARLGYKSEFKWAFSPIHTIRFAVSIMGIFSSVSAVFFFPLMAAGHLGMTFGWIIPSLFTTCAVFFDWPSTICEAHNESRTSTGLYYFSAKLAPPEYAPLLSWITGWANVTGQISLMCSLEFVNMEMIAIAISVGTDSRINLGPGPT
ncbi:hypothetical protein P691DRAFT_632952, partial [Macrolepiota fuliginosa MF-IS2]